MRKTYNKALALIIAAVMLTALLPSFAIADTAEENLIFDMDLSTYATNGDVLDASESGTSTITVNGTPKLGTLQSGKKYLTFDDSEHDGTAPEEANAINVSDDNFKDQDALTIETWVRGDYGTKLKPDRNWIFSGFAADQWSHRMIARVYWGGASNALWGEAMGDDANLRYQIPMSSYDGKWMHIVMTRQWTPASEGTGGTWTSALYINGQLQTETPKTYAVAQRNADGTNTIIIGNSKAYNQSFDGDIATFKVYNSILDDETVSNKYNAEKADFEAVESSLIFDMDLSTYEVDGKVLNTSQSGASTITVNGAPKLGALESGKKYLTFDDASVHDGSAPEEANAIIVSDNNFKNQDALTIETWIRGDYGTKLKSDRNWIFSGFDNSNYYNRLIARIYWGGASNALWGEASGDDAGLRYQIPMANYDGKWMHVVMTRQWTPASEGTGGTWTSALYIDGQPQAGTPMTYTVNERAAENTNSIIIGNSPAYDKGFDGDIAEFRVYREILDNDRIVESYNASNDIYQPGYPDIGGDSGDEPGGDTGGDVGDDEPDKPLADTVITYEDISSQTAGTHPTGSKLYLASLGEKGNLVDIKVEQAFNADESESIMYYALGNDDTTKQLDTVMGHEFSPSFTGDFALDVNLRTRGGTPGSRGLRWGYNTTLRSYGGGIPASKMDAFGFSNLRYTFIKNKEGKYVVTEYDLLDNNKQLWTLETDYTSCPMIILQQYCAKASQGKGIYLDVSHFKLMHYTTPKVEETDADEALRGAKEITLTLSEDIDETTLSADSVVIKDSVTGDRVMAKVNNYDIETRVVTIELKQYLKAGAEYNISLVGVKNVNGFECKADNTLTFTTTADPVSIANLRFEDTDGGVLDKLGANADIKVTLKVKSTSATSGVLKVFLALYDDKGVIREVKTNEIQLTSTEQDIDAQLTRGITPKAGWSAKCFAWEITSDDRRAVLIVPAELK